MKNKMLIRLNHKLYEIEKKPRCSDCGKEVSVILSAGTFSCEEQKATKETCCQYCGNDVVITFERVRPKWVMLDIGSQGYKIESLQTCNTPWCQQEFLITQVERFIEKSRAEKWHVPVACPHCHDSHWVNLHKLDD